jgi:hypothetical protein
MLSNFNLISNFERSYSSDASENLIIWTACICPSHPLLFKIGFRKMYEPYCILSSEGRLVFPEQVWENSLYSTLPDYFYQIKGRQKVGREDSICKPSSEE